MVAAFTESMTLVLNEIHFEDGFRNPYVIAAADSRIVDEVRGRVEDKKRKIFLLPRLRGAVSFFGLAEVWVDDRRKDMSLWLSEFIRTSADMSSLQSFSEGLREALRGVVPETALGATHSGFHICGFRDDDLPDFWFLTNIGKLNDPAPFMYGDFHPRYDPPSSHFLGRDARTRFGWNGKDPTSLKALGTRGLSYQMYRNGDFKPHVIAWDIMDLPLWMLGKFGVLRGPDSPEEHARYLKAKFEFMAAMSEKFYLVDGKPHVSYIGRPIDVILMTPDGARTI